MRKRAAVHAQSTSRRRWSEMRRTHASRGHTRASPNRTLYSGVLYSSCLWGEYQMQWTLTVCYNVTSREAARLRSAGT